MSLNDSIPNRWVADNIYEAYFLRWTESFYMRLTCQLTPTGKYPTVHVVSNRLWIENIPKDQGSIEIECPPNWAVG